MRSIFSAIILAVIAALTVVIAYALLFQWTAERQAELPEICAALVSPVECIAAVQEAAP